MTASVDLSLNSKNMDIDRLIQIVCEGGTVRTGIDIYNRSGALLLAKDVLVTGKHLLLVIKEQGVCNLDIDRQAKGGVWDREGRPLFLMTDAEQPIPEKSPSESGNVKERIKQIQRTKKEAAEKFKKAKNNIEKVMSQIRENGGQFDVEIVEDTVSDIFSFLRQDNTAFSCLTKDILSYDDYLYTHSVNVCAIGTAVLNHFNHHFSRIIGNYFASLSLGAGGSAERNNGAFYTHYQPSELKDMAMGYFLHDAGKVLISNDILNKKGTLTAEEYRIVRTHSFEKGAEVVKKNRICNSLVENILLYHHTALFREEKGCYPSDRAVTDIPPYVKIAKLSDIYDAMTSKRCYKDAFNPINVVTTIFRTYADKDPFLQILLHSFVKIIGIHPPGSILTLRNGQMAYVLLSEGPVVIPFTDGDGEPLLNKPDPIDLASTDAAAAPELQVDKRRPLTAPAKVLDLLPVYIRELLTVDA